MDRLYLTERGHGFMLATEKNALELEQEVAAKLNVKEPRTLISLLQKIDL